MGNRKQVNPQALQPGGSGLVFSGQMLSDQVCGKLSGGEAEVFAGDTDDGRELRRIRRCPRWSLTNMALRRMLEHRRFTVDGRAIAEVGVEVLAHGWELIRWSCSM